MLAGSIASGSDERDTASTTRRRNANTEASATISASKTNVWSSQGTRYHSRPATLRTATMSSSQTSASSDARL